MYRPNFCAECGERIVHTGRRLLTSRRFCRRCAARFRRGRLLRPLALCLLLVGGGFLAGRAVRTNPAPHVIERSALKHAPLPGDAAGRGEMKTEGLDDAGARAAPRYGPGGSKDERPTEVDEVVSICGARTKKGTACRRRVRGEGRCWQHRGKAAILPPAKLLVPG